MSHSTNQPLIVTSLFTQLMLAMTCVKVNIFLSVSEHVQLTTEMTEARSLTPEQQCVYFRILLIKTFLKSSFTIFCMQPDGGYALLLSVVPCSFQRF